jgi:hypothetical protein
MNPDEFLFEKLMIKLRVHGEASYNQTQYALC